MNNGQRSLSTPVRWLVFAISLISRDTRTHAHSRYLLSAAANLRKQQIFMKLTDTMLYMKPSSICSPAHISYLLWHGMSALWTTHLNAANVELNTIHKPSNSNSNSHSRSHSHSVVESHFQIWHFPARVANWHAASVANQRPCQGNIYYTYMLNFKFYVPNNYQKKKNK